MPEEPALAMVVATVMPVVAEFETIDPDGPVPEPIKPPPKVVVLFMVCMCPGSVTVEVAVWV